MIHPTQIRGSCQPKKNNNNNKEELGHQGVRGKEDTHVL